MNTRSRADAASAVTALPSPAKWRGLPSAMAAGVVSLAASSYVNQAAMAPLPSPVRTVCRPSSAVTAVSRASCAASPPATRSSGASTSRVFHTVARPAPSITHTAAPAAVTSRCAGVPPGGGGNTPRVISRVSSPVNAFSRRSTRNTAVVSKAPTAATTYALPDAT